MAENRTGTCYPRDTVCIDTYRVLDSCRDKDCFEDVRVFLTSRGQEVIDRSSAVRVKSSKVTGASIDTDEVPFNRGFYQLTIRLFVTHELEGCLGAGNVCEFAGVSVLEKRVVLFGSEGNVSVFKSDGEGRDFCTCGNGCGCSASTNLPIAVIETVDPIVLKTKVVEPGCPCKCTCCCSACDVPESICEKFGERFTDGDDANKLLISLGLFSVVRIERPAQYLITATEHCVPSKECTAPADDDPCAMFESMCFPTSGSTCSRTLRKGRRLRERYIPSTERSAPLQ